MSNGETSDERLKRLKQDLDEFPQPELADPWKPDVQIPPTEEGDEPPADEDVGKP